MKKIFLSAIMLSSILLTNAQSLVSMTDQDFTFSTGSKEATKVTFKDVSVENLTDALKAYFKDNYKAKTTEVRKTDGEYEVEDFKATDIQQKITAALVRIIEIEGNAILYIHYKSDGYTVSEKVTPELYPAYKKMTQNIANQAIKLAFKDKIANTKKTLAEKEKEVASFEKTVEKNEAEVVKMTSENKTAEGTVNRLDTDLAKQKTLVNEKAKLVTEKEAEIASIDVKSLEKEIKKVEKTNKKADKTISKNNGMIAKYKEKISSLESNITTIEESKVSNNKQIEELKTKITNHNQAGLEDQLKLLEKNSKEALSEEKSILKSIDKERASIEKNKVKISETQKEIADAKASQEIKKLEINKLKEKIKTLESKISSLK